MSYSVQFNDQTGHFEHHGILGQKWGKKNGPPYPLDKQVAKEIKQAERTRRKMNKAAMKAAEAEAEEKLKRAEYRKKNASRIEEYEIQEKRSNSKANELRANAALVEAQAKVLKSGIDAYKETIKLGEKVVKAKKKTFKGMSISDKISDVFTSRINKVDKSQKRVEYDEERWENNWGS